MDKTSEKQLYFKLLEKSVKVRLSERKTISLIVHPDCSIEVRTPIQCQAERVEQVLIKKANWLNKKIAYFESLHPLPNKPKEFVSGESFYYFGKQYKLQVKESKGEESVNLSNGHLSVSVHDSQDRKKVKNLLARWFSEKAKLRLSRILFSVRAEFKGGKLPLPIVSVKTLKKSWGICRGNQITLNQKLIHFPLSCIEYVALHELCHLIHRNHGKEFYKLLAKNLPNWKKEKQTLESNVWKIIYK